jgi:hypothetical protein
VALSAGQKASDRNSVIKLDRPGRFISLFPEIPSPNLFARQSRFHLIKLPETIALHAYATNIKN